MQAITRTGKRLSLNITGGRAFVGRLTGRIVNNGLNAYSADMVPVGHCVRWSLDPATTFEAETRNGRVRRFQRLWQAVRWLARHANA